MASAEAKVEGPLVPVDPSFAIAGEVITRSHVHALLFDDDHVRCYSCDQSVMHLRKMTLFTMNDLEMTLLAHLMQCHGWTRENAA